MPPGGSSDVFDNLLCSGLRLKDEPKPSFNQAPLFVSHTLTSDSFKLKDLKWHRVATKFANIQYAAETACEIRGSLDKQLG